MSYMTRDQMIATFAAYETNYPNLVKSEVVGYTVENRELRVYKIGNPGNGPVMFSAGTHGFEKAAVEVLKLFVDWVLTSSDAKAVRIRQRNYVLVLPCLDLDGYPDLSGMNKNSINLYRHFNWRYGLEGATHVKDPDWTVWTNYHGADDAAETEPETLAMLAAWAKFLPRHYIDMHVGSSDKKLWYTWLADAADKQMMIDVGERYTKRATIVGAGVYPVEENTNSSGCPVSASYHRNNKKIFGWVNEIAPQNPPYADLASIYWPAWKSVAIQLAQESEYVDANVHIVIANREVDPGEIRLLRVHLGRTKEVSSFELELNNPDQKYSFGGTEPFALGDSVVLYVGRGQYSPKIFTGTLETPLFHAEPNDNWVRLTGRCLGKKWMKRLVTKKYVSQKGEAIIKDVLDNFVGLTHVRNAVELVETCSTTYTLLDYDYKPSFDILKELSRDSDLSGVIGFDGRVAPDGLFEWFPVGSKTNSVDITEEAIEGDYEIGIPAVKNRIWVHGYKPADNEDSAKGRTEPSDADLWTLDAVGNWYVEKGTMTSDTGAKKVGANSIRMGFSAISPYEFIIRRGVTLSASGLDGFRSLQFWCVRSGAYQSHTIQLLCGSDSNYFECDITSESTYPNWLFIKRILGSENTYDADKNPTGQWVKHGTPDWNNITAIRFYCRQATATADYVWYDGLHFGHARFRYMAEDVPSQTAYGLAEMQETNDECYSNHECEMFAKSLLAWLKNPFPETIALKLPNLNYGMTPILAGDKKHVHLPNEKIDSDWIIDNVVLECLGPSELSVTLNFGQQKARLADYFYANRELLKKLGKLKRGLPTGSVG